MLPWGRWVGGKDKIRELREILYSFTTNVKGTFLGRKQKKKKRPTEKKPKTIKKMVIGSYLNVNGLDAPTKRHRLLWWMKMCMYALPLTTLPCLTFPNCM